MIARLAFAVRWLPLVLLIGLTLFHRDPVQAAPVCKHNVRYPRIPPLEMCAEVLVDYPYVPGLASITALTFGPDGSLYFARPLTSQIMRLKPDNSGFLVAPYPMPQVFASALPEPPNGLTYYDGAFYVAGDKTITRLRDTDGDGTADEQHILVHDLPGGAGGWLGTIHVGPDNRLYVAKAASCNSCIEADPRRAALLSFALDGSDPQIVARGLRDSYDFGWQPGSNEMYVVDNERPGFSAELNLIPQPGQLPIPDFGWPYCDPDGQPVPTVEGASQQICEKTEKPIVKLTFASHPTGVAFYQGDAFPALKGKLLVALAGSWNTEEPTGYALQQVNFGPNGRAINSQVLLPNDPRQVLADSALTQLSFYPDHPTSLAISKEGWIYLSVLEGRIYRFRSREFIEPSTF